jgi:anti-sigma B factor antagonist
MKDWAEGPQGGATMAHEAATDLLVRATPEPTTRIIEFQDVYLNYERTDELKPRLKELIGHEMAGGCVRVILDLGRLGVIDSCGLATLVSVGKQVRLAGGTLALCGLSEMIGRLFELTGLDQVFEVHPSALEALAAVSRE